MSSYSWRCTYAGEALETGGIVSGEATPTAYWFFSPYALVTRGFIFGTGDIWFNLDSSIIQNVTWTPDPYSPEN